MNRSLCFGVALAATLVAIGPAGAARMVDGALELDTLGGPPVAGAVFPVAMSIESQPKPTGPAFEFVVTLTLPAGVDFVSNDRGNTGLITCSGTQTVTCRGHHIGGEFTADTRLRLRATRAGAYTIRGAVSVQGDTDATNDTATVQITVSPAPRCLVPKLRGKPVAMARAAVVRAGCRVGTVTRIRSATVAKGRVVRTTPAAGRSVARGTSVALFVSRGA